MRASEAVWVAILSAVPLGAAGQVFKCQNAGGKVTYQQSPCDGSVPAAPLPLQPALRAAPRLGERAPKQSAIDECIQLHGFVVGRDDFRTRPDAARYVYFPENWYTDNWNVSIGGEIAAADGKRIPDGILCPVTADGDVDQQLFREHRRLKADWERREAAEIIEKALAEIPRRPAILARVTEHNKEKAGERRIIAQQGRGTRRAEVLKRLGAPDAEFYVRGTCYTVTYQTPYACPQYIYVYAPAPLDPQMRTTIIFDGDLTLKIERTVER